MNRIPQNRRSLARRVAAATGLILLATAGPSFSDPSKKELGALKAVFPSAERFDSRDVLLTDEMVKRIEKLARAKVKQRMVTFYTARQGGTLVGYAVIHSHVVRTKSETFTIGFEPDGKILRISIVAFQEPAEYQPSEKWLEQFKGKGPTSRLSIGDDLAPITGATLSARSIAEESRVLLQTLQAAVLGAKP